MTAPANIVGAITAADIPTWRAAYSDRTSAVMARFCELAYTSFEVVQPGASNIRTTNPSFQAIEPQAKTILAQSLTTLGFNLVETFNFDSAHAFLASSDEFWVLAFRGTQTAGDWGINLNVDMVPLNLLNDRGCVKVHKGFLNAFLRCDVAIQAALSGLEGTGLYITGHSLGGALAQIASAYFERDELAACYTFGSPRVGDAWFDAIVKCPHYRVVDHWDIVPTVPPPFIRGYVHTGDPRLIWQGLKVALRRDRSFVAKAVTNLIGAAALIITQKAVIIADHAISRYKETLATIATERQTPANISLEKQQKSNPVGLIFSLAAIGSLMVGVSLGRRRR